MPLPPRAGGAAPGSGRGAGRQIRFSVPSLGAALHAACQNAARERARHSKIHLRAAGCDRSGRQSAARIRRIPSCLLRTHLGVSIGTQTDRIRSTRLGMSMSVRRTSSAGTHRNGSFGTCRRPCAHTARPPAASARPRPSPATCPVCEGTGPERVQRDREKVKWRGGVEGRSTREPARNGAQRRWWEHQFAAERAVPLWLGRGHEKISACLKLTPAHGQADSRTHHRAPQFHPSTLLPNRKAHPPAQALNQWLGASSTAFARRHCFLCACMCCACAGTARGDLVRSCLATGCGRA